jgi:peroxiredoxin Q/BCP
MTQQQVILGLAFIGGALVLVSAAAPRMRQYWRDSQNVAAEAKEYLRERNVKPLEVDLDTLLAESRDKSLPTLPHPLLNQLAPGFELSSHNGQKQSLAEQLSRGPVVVVFYYGYYCNHCVSQLFALQDDLAKFRELGAEVIAISADTPEQTTEKFAKYGQFTFPVLADPDNKTAEAFSIFAPASEGKKERLLHGTFVIDKEGVVRWCHYGDAPFTANATLLVELAKLQGRLPSEAEKAKE